MARGGEALGGIAGAFRYMIQTEGLLSLYKGLVPSIASMALSGAVFYGVYDILKSSYLHTPEGRKRLIDMKQQGHELNALDRLELGPIRTLMYGAIAGACTEVATYPFEVVRRQLQMQMGKNKLNALAMGFNIIERGGLPALYAGLLPSLLQVCTILVPLLNITCVYCFQKLDMFCYISPGVAFGFNKLLCLRVYEDSA